MGFINNLIDFVLHLDKYLNLIIQNFGLGTYAILFLIIFAETGLVAAPFLPGDSLLFTAGVFAAAGSLNVMWLFVLLSVAAILGDSANYAVGKFLGPKMFKKHSRFLKKEYLDKTHKFYDKYGKKTIVLARFVPIVRTFAPFVAGIGKMDYRQFLLYNIAGGISWVAIFVFGGYYFGNIPLVKENLTAFILLIIVLSILPAVIEVWRHYKRDEYAPNK